jgi:sulfatase maturation enzyme AslB (radical SAM superfamily)
MDIIEKIIYKKILFLPNISEEIIKERYEGTYKNIKNNLKYIKNIQNITSITVFENCYEGLELLKNVKNITIITNNKNNENNKKIINRIIKLKKINKKVYIKMVPEIKFGLMALVAYGKQDEYLTNKE